ncbi:MAG: GNAT family N-acetyltransferase [Bryobacteraceae bacterium]
MLEAATTEDVADLVSLRNAVNQHLISQYGKGHWAAGLTEKGVRFAMRTSTVYVARRRGRLIATLALSTKKPWAIDKKYFSASRRPLYLTSMAVAPDQQRQGVGRLCIKAVRQIAAEWPSDAIRLDAYDSKAGAGEFYAKCGFREVGRATYRNAPLIYFEMLL